MSLKEIVEIAGYLAGTGLFGLALNEVRKKYVNWAEQNKFYDEDVKFSDLENKNSSGFNQELTKMQYKRYVNSVN